MIRLHSAESGGHAMIISQDVGCPCATARIFVVPICIIAMILLFDVVGFEDPVDPGSAGTSLCRADTRPISSAPGEM